jgi:hypothetical protein
MATRRDLDQPRTSSSALRDWVHSGWGITILGGLVVAVLGGVIVLLLEYGIFVDEVQSPISQPGRGVAPVDTSTPSPSGGSFEDPALLAFVTSDPRPWPGQSQRSSSNFSIQQIPKGR